MFCQCTLITFVDIPLHAKRRIDQITGGSEDSTRSPREFQASSGDFDFGQDVDWIDDDGPLDMSLEVTAEGDEGDILRLYSGNRCVVLPNTT